MIIDTPRARLQLDAGRITHLDLAPRTRVLGRAGQAWITFDHDRRDIVLGAGESFLAERGGHAIVCALRHDGAAEIDVIEAAAA